MAVAEEEEGGALVEALFPHQRLQAAGELADLALLQHPHLDRLRISEYLRPPRHLAPHAPNAQPLRNARE